MSDTDDLATNDDPVRLDPTRRLLVSGGFGAAAVLLFGCAPMAGSPPAAAARSRLGFQGIAPSTADAVTVADGYVAMPMVPWGEPVGIAGAMPAFRIDASNSAEEQALQMGMHHDGIHFYPFDGSSTHGLLTMNHEYTDDGLLHPGGMADWSEAKVRKAQAAHGISVIEIRLVEGQWQVLRPSRFARRITANTACVLQGPVAGHALVRTAADPTGRTVLGTLANCGAGRTPWGTYLSGEENIQNYFDGGEAITSDQRRWDMVRSGWYKWAAFDERFDARKHPNEYHRFGWVVEVDPMDPGAAPIKRTALGRAAHEGAWVAVTKSGRAVVYSGEDGRFEYIYKFVSRDPIAPGAPGLTPAQANRELLDHGTLYAARFDADGTGRWLPLVHGQGGLVEANGFADQGEVLIKTRQACDLIGATKMDRPEWLAIDQAGGQVFCSLTNNNQRGAAGKPGVDAANPRANNTMGQILRWHDDGDFDGLTLRWSHLLLAGDPANARAEAQGNIRGDAFACPDTVYFDAPRGLLWIGCDVGATSLNKGEMAGLGNNHLLACDPATGEVRRFLTGPVGCELTGATMTPDGTTLFVNIQHPGETPSERSNPNDPRRYSNWPDFNPEGRPRSATLAIRRKDGGVVGT